MFNIKEKSYSLHRVGFPLLTWIWCYLFLLGFTIFCAGDCHSLAPQQTTSTERQGLVGEKQPLRRFCHREVPHGSGGWCDPEPVRQSPLSFQSAPLSLPFLTGVGERVSSHGFRCVLPWPLCVLRTHVSCASHTSETLGPFSGQARLHHLHNLPPFHVLRTHSLAWREGGRYTVQHRLTMCHDERLCGGDTRGNAAARHGDAVHTARERETLTKWQARHPSYCCFRNRLPFKRATCSCKASPGLLSCSNIPEGAVGVGGVPQAWKLRGQPGLRAVPGGHAWLPLAVPGSPADSGGGVPLLDTDLSGRLVPIYTRTCHHLISPSTNLMAGACPGFSVMVKN